ncbi:MAG: nuclear transport factor 2 family protein [Rhodobacteraceae bacterium]|jgi:4-oxalocrotonate tautomerase|uniref:nuclear transport factor 2 family protein n=1 Tax=Albidovulum sp. TaxID=1872424 RepID=UPI001D580CE9|nr:nuclear transport factor 2 family protein [uncultured Defluviimonas sp.]MCB2127430.1 nuclear transport factor 2 family protein [Paracoccaceae bacterium]MCC0068539.1 nuclear transport factor 2 family protein [Paracoccaceae bacterium]
MSDFAAVTEVLGTYFDGLHHSDTARLARVFHPQALYASASDGTLLHRTMGEYFPVVDARPSPASRGEPRADRIVSIAFAGPVTATAVVTCAIGGTYFTDCLTLVLLDGRWQIIAKVFHAEARTR